MMSMSKLLCLCAGLGLGMTLSAQPIAVSAQVVPAFALPFCSPIVHSTVGWVGTDAGQAAVSSDGTRQGVATLDGVNQYVDLVAQGFDSSLLTTSFTIDLSVRQSSFTNWGRLFEATYGTSDIEQTPAYPFYERYMQLNYIDEDRHLSLMLDYETITSSEETPMGDDATWQRVTAVFNDQTKQYSLYENGVLMGTHNFPSKNRNDYLQLDGLKRDAVFLGKASWEGARTYFLHGEFDYFTVYAGVYTPDQLTYGQAGQAGSACAVAPTLPAPVPTLPAPGTNGDPQFTGFSGQSYQIHGLSNAVYNIISTPRLQLNALFTFLEQGRCRKGTQCFSHPGNYFGSVGVLVHHLASDLQSAVAAAFDEVVITAGAVDVGLTVTINNSTSPLAVGSSVSLGGASGYYSLSVPTAFEVRLESSEFSLRISNSDFFLNQDVSIGDDLLAEVRELKRAVKAADRLAVTDSAAAAEQKAKAAALRARLPHGLLGQSWNTATYNNRWKHIEGTLTDYQMESGLTGTAFKYNRF